VAQDEKKGIGNKYKNWQKKKRGKKKEEYIMGHARQRRVSLTPLRTHHCYLLSSKE
jgi:hypothetical protein